MYCGIGECRQTDEFVQIFNSYDNHWVIIYAVTCAPGELQVYDSLYRRVSKDIKELVDTLIYDRTAIHQANDGDAEHSRVCFFFYFSETIILLIY